jgi:hypothetical protein
VSDDALCVGVLCLLKLELNFEVGNNFVCEEGVRSLLGAPSRLYRSLRAYFLSFTLELLS